MIAGLPTQLLSRIEDAGINASAPTQQRWLDGWIVRFCPGKAKRARCINPVAAGLLPVESKLALSRAIYSDAGLPLFVRITPFAQPAGLDATLEALGLQCIDDTCVMVLPAIIPAEGAVPAGATFEALGSAAFAQLIGQLRGSPLAQRQAQAHRLEQSPVPFHAFALKDADGQVLACGQFAIEAELAGLYDVFTEPSQRGRRWAGVLCKQLLHQALLRGARVAYLQVERNNEAARRVYRRLSFNDAYSYHYRCDTANIVTT